MQIWGLRKCRRGLDQQLVVGLCYSRVAGCLNEVLGFGDVMIAEDQKRNLHILKIHILTEEHCLHMF